MTIDYANKRSSERLACTVPVDGKKGSTFAGLNTIDVSKDGIGFLSDHDVPLNEKIAIELALSPDEDPVLVLGVVKWVHPISSTDQFRVGLKFEMVLSGSQQGLDEDLHNRLKERGFDMDDDDFNEFE